MNILPLFQVYENLILILLEKNPYFYQIEDLIFNIGQELTADIMIKVLVLCSPFAFLCLINHSTSGFFKSWYKCFLSLLLVQVLVALILLLPYAIIKDNSTSLFNKLLLIGSIYALLKSGEFLREFMGGIGITANFQSGISGLRNMFRR